MTPHIRRSFGDKTSNALMLTGLTQLPPFPPAPAMPAPFVGREREQAQALDLLRRRGVVAISGGVGSGKTALAAALIKASGSAACHIHLSTGLNDRIDAFLWQIARPLAYEQPAIWRALHQIEQARWNYPPLVRLQMILEGYAQRSSDIIIWIDGIENSADSALTSLVEGLCEYVAHTHRTQLRLIIEGRSLPYRLQPYAIAPLQGLLAPAIVSWAHALALTLTADEAERMYQQTGGLPQAVAMLMTALQRGVDRTDIERVVFRTEIRRFISYMIRPLTGRERALLAQIAAASEQHPLTPNIALELETLEDLQLVTVTPNNVQAHPLIRRFYQSYTLKQ
jgi:hypothetical protein